MSHISKLTKKRLKNDYKEIKKEPLENIDAEPNEKNILEWYFIVYGAKDTPYENGIYLGKLILPEEYPLDAPDCCVLTPNGRFTTKHKICLSNTGFHKNEWSASWSIKNMLIGFLSIMLNDSDSGIGHIRESPEKRKKLRDESLEYNKKHYMNILKKFDKFLKKKNIEL